MIHIHRIFSIIFALSVLASCSTSKDKLTYFKDIEGKESGEFPMGKYSFKIQPDDELYITVTSLLPEATAPYNLPLTNPGYYYTLGSPATEGGRQQTYLVNSEGDINFPVIGKIHVAGMTTEELTKFLTEKISADVVDPLVMVRIGNFHVKVIGEVNHPTTIDINRERFSLLDALAAAGDLTPYGERSNVMLIRETDGKRTYHRMNLNDSEVLNSPYFYLQPNDVVLVQPNDVRQDNAKYNQNNAYKLTVISTVVSAVSIIASLVIALTVK